MNTNKEVNKQEERIPQEIKDKIEHEMANSKYPLLTKQYILFGYALASQSSIDTGVEDVKSGILFIHISSGQVHECIGTDEKKIWYVPDGEMESKSFLSDECRLLTPAEKYVLTIYDTKYPQMADKEIKAFIAGAKWASSGEAVDWVDANTTPPTQNGYYICWCRNPSEPGLIHYHKDTGWQNGFYDDRVTHYKLLTPPKP